MVGKRVLNSSSWAVVDKFDSQIEEQIKKELILGFTEEGDLVFDPFVGNGETLYACHNLNRNGISLTDNNEKFHSIGEEIKRLESQLQLGEFGAKQKSKQLLLKSKPKDFDYLWQQYQLPEFSLVVSFLPNWKLLATGSEQVYPGQNLTEIQFLEKVFTGVKEKLRPGAYLLILLGNEYQDGKYLNYSHDFIAMMQQHFQLKGEKVIGVTSKASNVLKNMLVTHKSLLVFRKLGV